jgi:hypothetical protein
MRGHFQNHDGKEIFVAGTAIVNASIHDVA